MQNRKAVNKSKIAWQNPLVWLVILIGLGACAGKKNDVYPAGAKIDSLFATVPDFSGVLLIANQGKPVYHKAFGYTNFDSKSPMDTTSIFELASVSKQFTSMIIMMLHEQGKLNYDDSLSAFIPELPYKGITVRHLLTHTSGLPDYLEVMDKYWDKSRVAGNNESIEYLSKYSPPMKFQPGSQYEYSNTGYLLLATIAERVSGEDFIAFSRNRIFTPLHMGNTNIRTQQEKSELKNMAWGHIWNDSLKRYIRADSVPAFNYGLWLGNRKGPGRISSTSSDLLVWDQALYRNTLVKNETLSEAFQPVKLSSDSVSNYGFGWELADDRRFGKVVKHSGGNPGYNTYIVRYIDANKTIIILCNNAHPKFRDLLNSVMEVIE